MMVRDFAVHACWLAMHSVGVWSAVATSCASVFGTEVFVGYLFSPSQRTDMCRAGCDGRDGELGGCDDARSERMIFGGL
jgi:hypothetical protein